jgi:hypothetical protein
MKEYPLGHFSGLEVSVQPSALAGFMLIFLFLAGVGFYLFGSSPGSALLAGFVAAGLHFASEFWHQLGHALFARWSDHPMSGMRFWWLSATSTYPVDEGDLPRAIHLRRAIGGPLASLALALLAWALSSALLPFGGTLWLTAHFFFLDNLLFFTLGSLLPLGFTDGSTIIAWLRE